MKPHLPFNFYHFIICFSTCLIITLGKVEAGEITTISYNSQGIVEFSGNGISARVENIEINNNRKVVFKDGAALKSGGSDFHGAMKPQIPLTPNHLRIPYSYLKEIKNHVRTF